VKSTLILSENKKKILFGESDIEKLKKLNILHKFYNTNNNYSFIDEELNEIIKNINVDSKLSINSNNNENSDNDNKKSLLNNCKKIENCDFIIINNSDNTSSNNNFNILNNLQACDNNRNFNFDKDNNNIFTNQDNAINPKESDIAYDLNKLNINTILYNIPSYEDSSNDLKIEHQSKVILASPRTNKPQYQSKTFCEKNQICNLNSSYRISKTNSERNLSSNQNAFNSNKNFSINSSLTRFFQTENGAILIVEDHINIRDALKKMIKQILKEANKTEIEIIEGEDGVDILFRVIQDQAENNRIKCIITEENMNYINGSQAVRIIRDLEKRNKIKQNKIATITAFGDEITTQMIKNAGVDLIFNKPCNKQQMKKLLEDFNII